jgi:hypothetical protein
MPVSKAIATGRKTLNITEPSEPKPVTAKEQSIERFEVGGGLVTIDHKNKTVNFEEPVDAATLRDCWGDLKLVPISGTWDGTPSLGVQEGWTFQNEHNLQNCVLDGDDYICFQILGTGAVAGQPCALYVENERVEMDKYRRVLLSFSFNQRAFFLAWNKKKSGEEITIAGVNAEKIVEFKTNCHSRIYVPMPI